MPAGTVNLMAPIERVAPLATDVTAAVPTSRRSVSADRGFVRLVRRSSRLAATFFVR